MRRAISLMVCLTSALAGCASTPTAPTRGELGPPTKPIPAGDLRPGAEDSTRWRCTDGLLEGTEFEIVTQRSSVAGASFATRIGDTETDYWSLADDGSLLLHAVDSHPDKTRSLFTPPLMLAPRSVEGNLEVKSESAMRAVRIEDETSQRDQGIATRTLRYVGNQNILVGGNEREARVVDVDFTADLQGAKDRRRSRLWVLPGQGIVAEQWDDSLAILKLFPKRSNQTSMRFDVQLPEAAAPALDEASDSTTPANAR